MFAYICTNNTSHREVQIQQNGFIHGYIDTSLSRMTVRPRALASLTSTTRPERGMFLYQGYCQLRTRATPAAGAMSPMKLRLSQGAALIALEVSYEQQRMATRGRAHECLSAHIAAAAGRVFGDEWLTNRIKSAKRFAV